MKCRQCVDDCHRLEADRDDAGEQVDDVARVADLAGPVVGVVDDPGALGAAVDLDLVPVEDPLDRTLAKAIFSTRKWSYAASPVGAGSSSPARG